MKNPTTNLPLLISPTTARDEQKIVTDEHWEPTDLRVSAQLTSEKVEHVTKNQDYDQMAVPNAAERRKRPTLQSANWIIDHLPPSPAWHRNLHIKNFSILATTVFIGSDSIYSAT